MDNAQHKFEIAGLGKAPFRVVGFEVKKYQACHGAPIQPGASCDFCATAIMNVYWIKGSGADDQRFKVGCDCVEKTGDRGLIRRAKTAGSAHKAAVAKAAKAKRIARLFGLLLVAGVRDALDAEPHPMEWRADAGDTRTDWASWMIRNSGNAGQTKVASYVEKIAKAAGVDVKTTEGATEAEALEVIDPSEPPAPHM